LIVFGFAETIYGQTLDKQQTQTGDEGIILYISFLKQELQHNLLRTEETWRLVM